MLPFTLRTQSVSKRGVIYVELLYHGRFVSWHCNSGRKPLRIEKALPILDRLNADIRGLSWSFALFDGEAPRRTDRYARKTSTRTTRKYVRDYRQFCQQSGHAPYIVIKGMQIMDMNDK